MPTAATVQAFVRKLYRIAVNKMAAAQSHFNDLESMLGIAPLEADPIGAWYHFEKPLSEAGAQHSHRWMARNNEQRRQRGGVPHVELQHTRHAGARATYELNSTEDAQAVAPLNEQRVKLP